MMKMTKTKATNRNSIAEPTGMSRGAALPSFVCPPTVFANKIYFLWKVAMLNAHLMRAKYATGYKTRLLPAAEAQRVTHQLK